MHRLLMMHLILLMSITGIMGTANYNSEIPHAMDACTSFSICEWCITDTVMDTTTVQTSESRSNSTGQDGTVG